MARRLPTAEDAREATDRLLDGLETRADIFGTLDTIRPLHPKNNTFPGDVFLRLAAHALAEGGVSPKSPIAAESLLERHLPECEFRGWDNSKIRYAVLAAAAVHGGVEVDLLEEVAQWRTDDFWKYAALAAIAWIRAVTAERAIPLGELCRRLRTRADVL